MKTQRENADTLLDRMSREAASNSEPDLARYLELHRQSVLDILNANPRQTEATAVEGDNPFLYTMR